MNWLKWIGTGCLAATLFAGPVFAQSAVNALAQKMSPNSLDKNPGVMQGAAPQVVADEANPQMVPAYTASGSTMSGLARVGGGKGKINVDLGKESDDPAGGPAHNIFDDPATLKMLGENPRFVYKAENLRDPMLIPWVRRMAIFKELIAQADVLIAAEKYDDAKKIYKRLQGLEDDRFTAELAQRMADLEVLIMAKNPGGSVDADVPDTVELPAWISDNTKAALIGEKGQSPVCLIGDFIVKEGDPVPGYRYVKVKQITKKVITFAIGDATFEVDLDKALDSDSDKPKKGAPRRPAPKRAPIRRPAR